MVTRFGQFLDMGKIIFVVYTYGFIKHNSLNHIPNMDIIISRWKIYNSFPVYIRFHSNISGHNTTDN